MTPDDADDALLLFMQNDPCLLWQFRRQLSLIRSWFTDKNRHKWKFYSSSILFVYSQLEPPSGASSSSPVGHTHGEECKSRALIRMIDFAHVFPNKPLSESVGGANDSPTDDNYIFGLNKLDEYFARAEEKLKKKQ